MKKTIIEADRKMKVKKCGEKAPIIAKVADSPGWPSYGIMLLILDGR